MKYLHLAAVLSLSLVACSSPPAPAPAPSSGAQTGGPIATRDVEVNARGYTPAQVQVPAGQPVTLRFTRTSDEGCGQQLVFPELGIRRDLPLGQVVPVTLDSPRGEIRFTCGMDMYRGMVVAQ